MRLIVQPGDGMMPLIKAIARANSTIEIVIFRLDHKGIERALDNAVSRGVAVRALIAHTNQAGEKALRKLEMRMLEAGVIVARTADDLARYHGKLMIVDHRELYLLAFNFTHADMEQSRSFGVIARDQDLVWEAVRLFDADAKRHLYEPRVDRFVVSPTNARQRLAAFISGARKDLRIYDPKLSDPAMIRILQERARAGVQISIIGRLARKGAGLTVRKLPQLRLHTRTIVRDGSMAFVGSQSLRALELDGRREVGLIFRDTKVVRKLIQTFDNDWATAEPSTERVREDAVPAAKVAKKMAKNIAKVLPPVVPVVNGIVKEVVGKARAPQLDAEVEKVLKDAVKDAVKEAVQNVVEEVVEQNGRLTR